MTIHGKVMNSSTMISRAPHCFLLRSFPKDTGDVPLQLGQLSDANAQDLANALPFLACGEESAVHAFSGSLLRDIDADEKKVMAVIADDELRHAIWLERLRQVLPAPNLSLPVDSMAHFFKRLLTRKAALHFARVAALDRAVCQLLAPILHAHAGLAAAPEIRAGLLSIARDEARHVQIAKTTALRLGLPMQELNQVYRTIDQQLWRLLAPVEPGLRRLAQQEVACELSYD